MAKLKWAITCQRVITDRETNLVSYIDGVEELHVPTLPFPLPLVLGMVWQRDEVGETIHLKVTGFDPTGNVFAHVPAELRSPDKIRHRANVTIGITAQHVGSYRFVVEQRVSGEWQLERELTVDVDLHPASLEMPEPPKKLVDSDVSVSKRSVKREKRK